jgi:hypothetical protein
MAKRRKKASSAVKTTHRKKRRKTSKKTASGTVKTQLEHVIKNLQTIKKHV